MKIRDQEVHPTAAFGRHRMAIALITAVSQAGVVAFSHTPGHKFQITKVSTYCLNVAATVSANLLVGVRTAAALTWTAATESAATLSTTVANVRGSESEAITLQYTTNGSGVLTNGFVIVEYRFRPMAGDLGPV